MAKISTQILTDGTLLISYECVCGEHMILETNKRQSRLMKCPDCMEAEGAIFRDDNMFKPTMF